MADDVLKRSFVAGEVSGVEQPVPVAELPLRQNEVLQEKLFRRFPVADPELLRAGKILHQKGQKRRKLFAISPPELLVQHRRPCKTVKSRHQIAFIIRVDRLDHLSEKLLQHGFIPFMRESEKAAAALRMEHIHMTRIAPQVKAQQRCAGREIPLRNPGPGSGQKRPCRRMIRIGSRILELKKDLFEFRMALLDVSVRISARIAGFVVEPELESDAARFLRRETAEFQPAVREIFNPVSGSAVNGGSPAAGLLKQPELTGKFRLFHGSVPEPEGIDAGLQVGKRGRLFHGAHQW